MTKAIAFARRLTRNRAALLGLVILGIVILSAASAPLFFPTSPWRLVGRPFLPPFASLAQPLGTDALGRSIIAGIFHGASVSLLTGVAASAAALLVGVAVGTISGYQGGKLDDLLMRFTEVFQTIPPFLFAIVIVAIFSPKTITTIGAISVVSWPGAARLVRAETLRLRQSEFVQSCRVLGMSDVRIILTQILPNCMAPIIVMASVLVANAILIESGLAFLGLGDPNMMSWGTMIGAGRSELRSAWHVCVIPGAAVLFTVLSLNLIGDGLNDALNPRLRRS